MGDILNSINRNIKQKIEERFNTIVNDYGCLHSSEQKFKEFTSENDIGKFIWCNYFVVPVDYEDKVVLPKTFYQDTSKLFSSYSDMLSPLSRYKREEYFEKLGSYKALQLFTQNYTTGASVVLRKLLRFPLNSSPEKIIDNADEIDDLRYLVICYYIDGI